MPVPSQPKIYHIVHVDRLASIIADGSLWSDAVMVQRQGVGTTIGMSSIKARRLNELSLSSYPDLHVGHCTPFYFCPRSVMLYLIYRRNEELAYKGGQEPIVHLEADLHATIAWAQQNAQRWAFTLSNAGAYYFEGKQAEFLIERSFPWHLVERIGVHSQGIVSLVANGIQGAAHRPQIEIRRDWYY